MTLCLLVSLLFGQGVIPRVENGTVAGAVRFADGTPAGGVRVAAMVVPDSGIELRGASTLVAISQTDASGRYRLEDVPSGRYYIVAGRIDAPTYYPAATDIAAARVIVVTAGATIEAIDLIIINPETARPAPRPRDRIILPVRPVPLAPREQLKGRIVIDSSSKGAKLPESVWLTVRYSGGTIRVETPIGYSIETENVNARVRVATDGTFSHTVFTGEATLGISGLPEGYSIKSITAGTTDLLLQSLDIRAGLPEVVIVLTADLQPRFKIGGQVPGGANGQLLGEHIELVSESGTASRVILDAEGRFLFQRVLPGKYVLRLSSSKIQLADRPITVVDHDVTVE